MEYKFSFFNKLALAYVSIILVLSTLGIIKVGIFIWLTGMPVGLYIFTVFAINAFKKKSFFWFILSSLASISAGLAIITCLLDSLLKSVL